MMTYAIIVDLVDDHLAMSKSKIIRCVKNFIVAMVEVFGPKFLRAPNTKDTAWQLERNTTCGFQGMLGPLIACIEGVRTVP
jgi:hypothetical protein